MVKIRKKTRSKKKKKKEKDQVLNETGSKDNVHYRLVLEKFIGSEWRPIEIFTSIEEVELEIIETALALDKKRKVNYIG